MAVDFMERPRADALALPPYLLDLVGQARRAVDVDPGLARRCLETMSALLAGEVAPGMDGVLPPATALAGRLPADGTVRQGWPKGGLAKDGLAKGGLAAWQLARIRQHVEDRLDSTILVEDLASIARLSPGHFCRAFKVSTGETPHGYIVRQRIRRAQRLMLSTDDTLSQIACACGLTDQAHLTRLFRRMLNETPLIWRRNWRAA